MQVKINARIHIYIPSRCICRRYNVLMTATAAGAESRWRKKRVGQLEASTERARERQPE